MASRQNLVRRNAKNSIKFFIDKIRKIKEIIASVVSGIVSSGFEGDPAFIGAELRLLSSVTPVEVSNLIMTTDLKFSPVGVIPASVIKLCPLIFGEIISRLANLSFTRRIFPTPFRLAQVKPLLKKSFLDPENQANFRPISKLKSVSKILEKLFLARIKPAVGSSENFCRFQSAYQERLCTETAYLKIFDDVYRNVDNQLGTICL